MDKRASQLRSKTASGREVARQMAFSRKRRGKSRPPIAGRVVNV
jgi:hypothetical protein